MTVKSYYDLPRNKHRRRQDAFENILRLAEIGCPHCGSRWNLWLTKGAVRFACGSQWQVVEDKSKNTSLCPEGHRP